MEVAKANGYGRRDAAMVLVLLAFRHGLRASELVDLRLGSGGLPNRHPARPQGQAGHSRPRAIRSSATNCGLCGAYSASRSPNRHSCSRQRGARHSRPPVSPVWSSERGLEPKLGFKVHPHMLRHACGHALANMRTRYPSASAYLGHRNIQHTVRYTELSPTRFKDFWRE